MDIALILLGVALYFAALASFSIDHFHKDPAQAVVSFFVPPFSWWLFYHYWKSVKTIVYTQIASILLIILGFYFSDLSQESSSMLLLVSQDNNVVSNQAQSAKNYPSSDEAQNDLAFSEERSASLNGKLQGKDFSFDAYRDLAEFNNEGDFVLTSGANFLSDYQIVIDFKKHPDREAPWSLLVRPKDKQVPRIHLSWYDYENSQFETKTYDSNYALEFDLEHNEYNIYFAKMKLVLSEQAKTFLLGSFPVYSSSLRFVPAGLNKHHDSTQTIEMIASTIFSNVFHRFINHIYGYEGTEIVYHLDTPTAMSTVYFKDRRNAVRKLPLTFFKNEEGWFLDAKGLEDQFKSKPSKAITVPRSLSSAKVIDPTTKGAIKPLVFEKKVVQEPVKAGVVSIEKSNQTKSALQDTTQITKQETTQITTQETTQEKQAVDLADTALTEQSMPYISAKTLYIGSDQEESILVKALLPLLNKELELETEQGKFKNGVYVGVHRKELILEEELGGGVVKFLTKSHQVKRLRILGTNNLPFKSVKFIHSSL